MKKSQRISLVLLASMSLAISACSPEVERPVSRASYKSMSDCEKEWGKGDCENDFVRGNVVGPFFYYQGGMPYMYSGRIDAWQPVPATAKFSQMRASNISVPMSAGKVTATSTFKSTSVGVRTMSMPVARAGFGASGARMAIAS